MLNSQPMSGIAINKNIIKNPNNVCINNPIKPFNDVLFMSFVINSWFKFCSIGTCTVSVIYLSIVN